MRKDKSRQGASLPMAQKKQKAPEVSLRGLPLNGGGALLSRFPSTIGAAGLNFPVRNGKGWIPRATCLMTAIDIDGSNMSFIEQAHRFFIRGKLSGY